MKKGETMGNKTAGYNVDEILLMILFELQKLNKQVEEGHQREVVNYQEFKKKYNDMFQQIKRAKGEK